MYLHRSEVTVIKNMHTKIYEYKLKNVSLLTDQTSISYNINFSIIKKSNQRVEYLIDAEIQNINVYFTRHNINLSYISVGRNTMLAKW